MKKEIKAIALVLVVLAIFVSGFGLGSTKEINVNFGGKINVEGGSNDVAAPSATPAPAPAPTATPTPAPSTPATPDATTTAPAAGDTTTAAPSASGIPSTPEEVATKYNEVINALKAEKNFNYHKVEDIKVTITDCSISAATKLLNPIVQGLVKPTDSQFDFVDGVSPDGGTPDGYIYPANRQAAVKADYLATATAAANPEGGYTMTIKFKAENATFDGTTSTEPVGHQSAMEPLNLGSLDISPATINNASMDYPGADVKAVVNADGKLTHLEVNLPMSGGGEGGISFFNVSVQLEGYMNATFDFAY